MEIFKDISGYEGIYQVSNQGKVKSLERKVRHSEGGWKNWKERIIKPYKGNHGYLMLGLSNDGHRKAFTIHRLVALAFISNPDNKAEVNHKDGDKTNNLLENLEWNTPSENTKHAHLNGFVKIKRNLKNGRFLKS